MSKSTMFGALIAASLLGFAGCGGGGGAPGTVPATATVTLDGVPLAGATVTLAPQSEGVRTAVGVTDASGQCTLLTAGAGQGVMPGQYKVAVSKVEAGGNTTPASQEDATKNYEEDMKRAFSSAPPPVTNTLPTIYSDPETSGLMAEVIDGGENNFTYALKK